MLLYCGLADRSQFTLCAAFTGGGVVVVFLVALCAHLLASRVRSFPLVEPTRGAVATSLVLAVVIVVGELVFFPTPGS